MKPGFSEFSYGYAITDELINWYGTDLAAAPVFPSLIEEGRGDVGYDLRLDRPGIPLFLQFKCPHHMEQNLSATREFRCGLFRTPFYRFELRPTKYSKQHPSLLRLESKGYEVYYVAPVFHEVDELNDAYRKKKVATRSIFFRPSNIGLLPDDKTHQISFDSEGKAYLLSDPLPLKSPLTGEQLSYHLFHRVTEHGGLALTDQSLQQLANEIVETVRQMREERSDAEFGWLGNLAPLAQIAYVSRTFLDCAFFILREKTKGNP